MSSNPASPVRRVWYKWKALRLPWRRKFLVGLDLSGNTYWEFRDTLTSNRDRMRRIVKCNTTIHYSDITSQISPAWHQWLRHTRRDPPSLTEQAQDISRQEQLKVLAARADARWAEKQDILDSPRNTDQPLPTLEVDKGRNKIVGESRKEGGSGTGIEQGSGVGGEVDNIGQDGVAEAVAFGVKAEVPGENGRSVANKHRVKEGKELEVKVKEAPWKITKGSGEGWQPQTWDPNTVASQNNK